MLSSTDLGSNPFISERSKEKSCDFLLDFFSRISTEEFKFLIIRFATSITFIGFLHDKLHVKFLVICFFYYFNIN